MMLEEEGCGATASFRRLLFGPRHLDCVLLSPVLLGSGGIRCHDQPNPNCVSRPLAAHSTAALPVEIRLKFAARLTGPGLFFLHFSHSWLEREFRYAIGSWFVANRDAQAALLHIHALKKSNTKLSSTRPTLTPWTKLHQHRRRRRRQEADQRSAAATWA